MTRKHAREAAFHVLYALTFHGDATDDDVRDLLSPVSMAAWRGECAAYDSGPGAEYTYIESVVFGVRADATALVAQIGETSEERDVKRIARVPMILMQMALYEPTAIAGVTQAVAINEAVELCKIYDPDAAGFVNGILGKLSRENANDELC